MTEDRTSDQKTYVQLAVEAGRRGDVKTFLENIDQSKILDGAKFWLLKKYPGRFGDGNLNEILTKSIDAFYEYCSKGTKMLYPSSILFRILRNKAVDELRYLAKNKEFDEYEENTVQQISEDVFYEDTDPEVDIAEGLKIARSLLPKLGEGNVQSVMKYIFDAVEIGVEDLSPKQISEALGLSQASVRKWIERGFKRLERASHEAGYHKDLINREVLTNIKENIND